jgi:hypothetical protein
MGVSTRSGVSHDDFSPINNGSGMATYGQTGSIAWSGTGAPSGTLTAEYTWQQVGKDVTLNILFIYTIAGNAVNGITFDFPTDAPPPATIAGAGTSASEFVWIGVGAFTTARTTIYGVNGRAAIQRNSGNNGWVIQVVSGAVNAVQVAANIQYKTV